ncbi:methyltransferase-like protein 9 [Contarinia nasturtii]|uniref:methyltransferase-like protein 9 n=1 Tax=Contarinia nasturtii TaxID=265458 RepID=UPI0012D3BDBA|nr:methyltransferase-like protein 9 [Contarinia nasturtii]XP_031620490.1 methyltransferase-like protein 9 [Contarinia nasturtii]
MTYRPRGTLARTLYDKIHNDQYLEGYDMRLWYTLTTRLPERFQKKFLALEQPDETTLHWLNRARKLSSNLWLQLWHLFARTFLSFFMTQTSINGLLRRGSMFILSEEQFKRLLTFGGFNVNRLSAINNEISILDIGAGDGEVTMRIVKGIVHMKNNIFLKVFATEYSWTMRERLQEKKFIVIDKLDEVENIDLVCCLNVLDRCADPHQILRDIHRALSPEGRAVIALVLPYSHYVETNTSHLPIKPLLPHWLEAISLPFDQEAKCFFDQLETMGFCIEAWTKAPYLCEGDLRQSFYWLVDVVVVLSKK